MPKSVEVLEEEILQLKSMLKMEQNINELGSLRSALKLTKQQAEILLLLYKSKDKWLTRERLEMTIYHKENSNYNPKCVEVQISKIRKLIGKECIDTMHFIGYKITDAGILKCREVLKD